ncbi:10332_t:CDS:2 [Funneliformis geosporum]|nr:10332_t:CDS:2 [Funneliformis geosporum]
MSGGGVTGAIAKLIGDLNVNKISEEASNNITEYWKRYKKLGGEVPPLTLEEKKTNLVKEVQDIIDHYTAGIADAERHFETKGQDDDADTNFKDIRYAILTVLAETLVSAYLIERDEKNLQKLVDAQRDPIFINIYTRSDFEDTIKDLGTVTSFENIKKDIDLGGADLTTLRGLKVGSSRDIIDKATGVSEHWKNYTPLATSTDGNCFLNALAILLTGDDKVETQKRVALQLRVALLLNLIQEHRYYFTNINDFYRVVLENSDDDTTTDSGSKMILKRPLISVFDDSKTKTKFKDSGGIGSFAMGIADQEDIYYYYKPFVIFNQGATHFEPLIINEKHTDGYIEFNCKKVTFEDEKNEADGRSILIETLGSAEDAEKKAKEYKNVKEMFVDGHGAFNKEGETFVISAIRADEINFDDDEIHLYHNTYSGINLSFLSRPYRGIRSREDSSHLPTDIIGGERIEYQRHSLEEQVFENNLYNLTKEAMELINSIGSLSGSHQELIELDSFVSLVTSSETNKDKHFQAEQDYEKIFRDLVAKVTNLIDDLQNNEQEKEACVNYMFDNQEIINQAELEEKAISKIPLHLSRFLANEELLRANLNSFKNAKEMVKE